MTNEHNHEAKAAPAVPQGWRKQRMANWPHSEHGMRLIGFVVPDDGRPLGLISERLEEIIGSVTPATPAAAAPSQPVTRPQNCGTSFCSCIECVCEPEPVTLTDSYAGVIAWIGDKQCKRVLTEGAIKHEHTPGVAMRNTAHQCVQEVIIAALREKEQTK